MLATNGNAVYNCVEDKDGTLWATNGEYSSQVNYCPFFGYKAKTQVSISIDKGKKAVSVH